MADDDPPPPKHHGPSGVGTFFIVLVVLLVVGIVGWVAFTHYRARRLGLPPPSLSSYIPFRGSSSQSRGYPSPAPGGIVGWVNDKIRGFKDRRNDRVAGGAYEEPLNRGGTRGRGSNRGFGALDPDEAWDTRVGNEADVYGPGGYYEEQELGLQSGTRSSAGLQYDDAPRGRSRSREPPPPGGFIGGSQGGLDTRYDEEMRGERPRDDPFGDRAEQSNISLRGVSPRPVELDTRDGGGGGGGGARGSRGYGGPHGSKTSLDSPTERRSMFKESI